MEDKYGAMTEKSRAKSVKPEYGTTVNFTSV
jgi:hypothetical protein